MSLLLELLRVRDKNFAIGITFCSILLNAFPLLIGDRTVNDCYCVYWGAAAAG